MEWKCEVVYVREGYNKAIIDADTKEIIAIASNLDSKFVEYIVHKHNKAISLARKEGVDIAKEVYKSNKKDVIS